MRPGITYLPPASIFVVPFGNLMSAAGPTARTRPPLMTTTPFGSGLPPVPSIMVPLTIAVGAATADQARGEARQSIATQRTARAHRVATSLIVILKGES